MKPIVLLETLFRGLIDGDVKPSTILAAFHNVCVHGKALEAAGWNVTDAALEKLFDGFETSLKALREMEK